MKKLSLILGLIILFFLGCNKDDTFITPDTSLVLKSASIDNQNSENKILVKFKDNKQKQNIGTLKKNIHGISVIEVEDVNVALNKLKNDPNVEYAEPNYLYNHFEIANDSAYIDGSMWGMNTEFGCGASNAWVQGKIGSNTVYVGILDQGFMYAHPDLADNAWINKDEIPGNNIDDDENGYVDDVRGWDFYDNDSTVFNENVDYHGTHVAGIVGAKGGNTIGVVGVNWNVKLISARFIGPYGGYTDAAVEAIYYFIALKNKGLEIVAINNSWGGRGRSRALENAIDDAADAGIMFVCAAGNSGDSKPIFPAGYDCKNIISVASIDKDGSLSSFSNYNKRTVDIAAPGRQIMSTYYDQPWKMYYGWIKDGPPILYAYLSGTSMATPHVTGAVALYKSIHPNATLLETKNAILNSSIPTPSLQGKVLTGGRLYVGDF